MGTETADRKAVVAIMLNQSMTVPIIEHSTPPKLQAIPKSVTDSVSATKVEYKQVGRSGLWVSNPILGTLGIGDRRWMDWLLEEEDVNYFVSAHISRSWLINEKRDLVSLWPPTREASIRGTLQTHIRTACPKK